MKKDEQMTREGENRWRIFEGSDSPQLVEEKAKKETILLAAATLFAKKGYAGTSVREIVAAAGVTKPTLYYYFKNKEDLYIKLMDDAMATFAGLLEDSLARAGNVRVRLLGLYQRIYELFRDHVDFLRLVNSIIYGPQGAAPFYDLKSTQQHMVYVISEMLEAGVRQGELREENANEVLLLLLGLLRSMQVLLVTELNSRMPLTLADIGRSIDLIFDGARAPLRNREAIA